MKLSETVASLSQFDDEDSIYATEPWSEDSDTIVARELESGGVPQSAAEKSMTYFIEIFIAREFLEGWEANEKRGLSLEEQCARLIRYATHDA